MTFGTEGEYTKHFVAGQRSGEGIYKYFKTKDFSKEAAKTDHGKGTFIFYDIKMKIIGDWFDGQIMKENARHNGKQIGWNTINLLFSRILLLWIILSDDLFLNDYIKG